MRYKSFNPNHLERKAVEVLAEHGKFDGSRLLVDELIDKLGYSVLPKAGLLDEFGVEAYIPKKPNLIFVDKAAMDQGFPRYYFTLAEEIAHILIHLPLVAGSITELHEWIMAMPEADYNRFEWDAKHLAGALLMPKEGFSDTFKKHLTQYTGKLDKQTVVRMAVRKTYIPYGVSFEAAAVRACCLKLISRADLRELRKYTASNGLYGRPASC
jgi:Zn-dependent peptidase ImmA (M78 family)